MSKILKFATNRLTVGIVLLILQTVFLLVFIQKLNEYFVYMYVIVLVLSVLLVLKIINGRDNPVYKLAFIIPILVLPVFGCLLYFFIYLNRSMKRFRKKTQKEIRKSSKFLVQDDAIIDELKSADFSIFRQSKYMLGASGYPVYKNTITQYLSPGEVAFDIMKTEIMKAEKYIFMEFFIVQEGIMWDEIHEILKKKVSEGVEVRLMYDDMGSIYSLQPDFARELNKEGIKCITFNPVTPIISPRMNNRDHRKIIVVDGKVAFTGGVNIADEYINLIVRFGHWKDSAVMMTGDAAWGFTVMFLQLWNATKLTDTLYDGFKPSTSAQIEKYEDGFVQPYADSPLDDHLISESVYLNIITKAKRYVYINTPYLVADNEIITALCLAAQSGVDVRIVTPHIEDKWYVHIVTRSNYAQLIEAGVKIYEYTPGFMHSKTFLADDELATVGTPNLDCRSLYMHFECGAWLYKCAAVEELRDDYMDTLKKCRQIRLSDLRKVKLYVKLLQGVLKVFSPLL